MTQIDHFIIYQVGPGNKKELFGFTKDSKLALSELNRLYQIDPYQTKYRYSLEMAPYRPMTGYELKKV
jgi:hypothetical protein